MKRDSIRRLSLGGLFAGLILLLTFAIKIPMPATGGYVHPGDGAIAYAGLLLGPYAALAAGVGSALADVLGGYALFALPTLFIKGGMGLIAGLLSRPGARGRNILAFTLAALWMAGGYFLTEWVMFGLPAAMGGLLPNLLQGACGLVFGMALSFLPMPASLRPAPHPPKKQNQEAH